MTGPPLAFSAMRAAMSRCFNASTRSSAAHCTAPAPPRREAGRTIVIVSEEGIDGLYIGSAKGDPGAFASGSGRIYEAVSVKRRTALDEAGLRERPVDVTRLHLVAEVDLGRAHDHETVVRHRQDDRVRERLDFDLLHDLDALLQVGLGQRLL